MLKKSQQDSSIDTGAISMLENPWDNVYWFARMLVNSDRYGGIGTESKTMMSLVSGLRSIIDTHDRHKIKYIWHLITFDRDLSDDKVTEMGSHRVILYLPDDSERYMTAVKHPGMKDYVRPMTAFVRDIKQET